MTVVHGSAAHSRLQVQLVTLLIERLELVDLFLTVGFNLGDANDYRVPDLGIHESDVADLYVSTALAVVEIHGPADLAFAEFGFYHAHGVQEILLVQPAERRVRVWQREQGILAAVEGRQFEEGQTLECAGLRCSTLENLIRWPS